MAAVLREYIAHFRIKELQHCLEQLGLSKRGRKLDLQSRLLAYLGESEALPSQGQSAVDVWKANAAGRVITEVWRQMQGLPAINSNQPPHATVALQERIASGAAASTSTSNSANAGNAGTGYAVNKSMQPAYNTASSATLVGQHNTQIRCICGENADRGTMVQCEDDACGVWQHCNCVGIDAAAMPDHYYCQNCRVALADPFWQILDSRLMPAAMLRAMPGRPVVMRSTGKEQMLAAERVFDLMPSQLEPLRKNPQIEQLHVACLLVDDPVANRLHWPRQAELRINAMVYRPYGRNTNSKLGINARDEPANAAHRCVVGKNRVSLQCAEDRQFCLMAYTVRRRSLEAVKKMMAPTETPEAAVARVASVLRGTKAGEEDDDDDLVISNTVISLKDPLSGTRIQVAARFAGVKGIVAFDFDQFMSLVQRSRKWQDPHTLRNVTIKQMQMDPWMQAVLNTLKDVPNVTEVEVNADGRWRPAESDMAWLSTLDDIPPLAKAQLTRPSLPIKPDPGADDNDSEAESEGAELRKAASAFAAASRQAKPDQPDVIVLDDSSDDDAPAPQTRPSQPSQSSAGPRFVWPANAPHEASVAANGHASSHLLHSQRHHQQQACGVPQQSAVPGTLQAAAHAVNQAGASGWSSINAHGAPANTQRSPSQQAAAAVTGGLRIKLPTRPGERLQPQQQHQHNHQTSRFSQSNGVHQPSSSREPQAQLATATSASGAARAVPQAQPQQQQRQIPSSLLGKRKEHDLNGHNGAYSQAAAQASGMSTLDLMHRAAGRAADFRYPQPYSTSMPSYGAPPGSGHQPYAPQAPYSSWAPTVHGNTHTVNSPGYSSRGVGSPGYSSGYSGAAARPEHHNADATRQPSSFGAMDAHSGLATDGDSFMDAVIDWPPDSAANAHDGSRQEARLAAWKARQGDHPKAAPQQAMDDVIVLD